ncbi:S8 family serine peptidase [Sedimentibacter sp. zth1]|uniref:S8 family serine peptidase n=1 Tax=Sedimentibacter sp. zth1 TaxID=2816908 RepID=UPI001A92F179|nr:S8 family serine peptidase [Sedimentibacter sp. zth1]QSX07254.1 S8 family serine peptidase [Sedimentibacter sp. zth1]
MKKGFKKFIVCIFILAFSIVNVTACSDNSKVNEASEVPVISIERVPGVADYTKLFKDTTSLPHNDKYGQWALDVRSSNLSSDNLMDRVDDLLYASFDSKTVWPDKLPEGFDPDKIMELYKDPGLNVRELHKKGITGKGVGIAIIDQCLLVDHIEYKDRLKYYEEYKDMKYGEHTSSMHGPAVASIAVGKSVGVAPEADLYYISGHFGDYDENNNYIYDYTYTANDIKKIIEINKTLPKNRKIRVISISLGFSNTEKGYDEFQEAVKLAEENGIATLTTRMNYNNVKMVGMGRKPMTNGNDFNDCCPGIFWMSNAKTVLNCKNLYIPMDFRCTAAPSGQEDYAVYINGGFSWSVPYVAGAYALACQVKPDITFEEFFPKAYETGKIIESNYKYYDEEIKLTMDKVISPVDLINKLQEEK